MSSNSILALSLCGTDCETAADRPLRPSFGDTYVSIENVIGTSSNDFIIGDPGINRLDGSAGDDILMETWRASCGKNSSSPLFEINC